MNMAKTNTVTNAKTAARKFLSAVVDGVKVKGSKTKGSKDTADTPVASQKVTGVPPAPTVPKGSKTDDTPKGSKGSKDTDDTPKVSKKKPKDTDDTPTVPKGKRKGKPGNGHKDVRDPKASTRKVKGAELNTVARVGADDVKRTRANWNGYSLCSLLKWVGYNGGDIDNARQLVASLGLKDETALSTISCQFYAGRQLSLGKKGNPLHSGSVADLTAADAKAVKNMAGM